MWEGFLLSPRLYRPLPDAFRPQLPETAGHYKNLHEHGQQYAAFLTYAALERMDGDDPISFQTAFKALPPDGLQEAARTLSQEALDLVSEVIAESFALMSIAAGEKFADAVDLIHNGLRPIEYPG